MRENRRKESVFLSNNVRGPEESLGTRRPWVAAAAKLKNQADNS